jgi:hypothetical protein
MFLLPLHNQLLFFTNVNFFYFVESQRPNFRKDYRYEKAFNAFYKVHTEAEKWSTAKIRCEAEGAELMVPETLDEADSMPVLLMRTVNRHDGAFVGIHDFYTESVFVTVNGKQFMCFVLRKAR